MTTESPAKTTSTTPPPPTTPTVQPEITVAATEWNIPEDEQLER